MQKLVSKIIKRVRRLFSDGDDEAIWCVVANVRKNQGVNPGKNRLVTGTKHFRAGTLVYCPTILWGDGYDKLKVVARHRGSHRFVTMVVSSSLLTNWRVKLVFSPHVIQEFREMGATWNSSGRSKRQAQQIANQMNERSHDGRLIEQPDRTE